MKNFLGAIASLVILSPFAIIGLCVLIMVLSMTVECVTGYDLIRQTIRPAIGKLLK